MAIAHGERCQAKSNEDGSRTAFAWCTAGHSDQPLTFDIAEKVVDLLLESNIWNTNQVLTYVQHQPALYGKRVILNFGVICICDGKIEVFLLGTSISIFCNGEWYCCLPRSMERMGADGVSVSTSKLGDCIDFKMSIPHKHVDHMFVTNLGSYQVENAGSALKILNPFEKSKNEVINEISNLTRDHNDYLLCAVLPNKFLKDA